MGQYDETLGVLLLGIIFNTYLYGIVSYQFAAYWRTPFNDRLVLKAMVLVLFILDTVHSAAVIYMAWAYCVTNFNNPSILAEALWPYTFTPPATALAAFITHAFLGYRVYRLMNNNLYIYCLILVVATASFTLGVYCGTRAWIIHFSADLIVLSKPVTAWLSIQAGLDLSITGLLSFSLLRSRTGFRKTDTIINTLIRGAIQTGAFAALFALGDLITFIKYPETNFYGMFAILIGRIYTNTLLDTLLTRDVLRAKFGHGGDVSFEVSGPRAISSLRWEGSSQTDSTAAHGIALGERGADAKKRVDFPHDAGGLGIFDDESRSPKAHSIGTAA